MNSTPLINPRLKELNQDERQLYFCFVVVHALLRGENPKKPHNPKIERCNCEVANTLRSTLNIPAER